MTNAGGHACVASNTQIFQFGPINIAQCAVMYIPAFCRPKCHLKCSDREVVNTVDHFKFTSTTFREILKKSAFFSIREIMNSRL